MKLKLESMISIKALLQYHIAIENKVRFLRIADVIKLDI